MARPPRIQFEGACYHIFSRGNRRARIFRTDADYARFEEILLETMRWSGVLLYNWSQMPNHFHFNVETPSGNLAEFMQRLKTRYAKHFNRIHGLVGHVFQGRYGAVLCEKEAHFQEIIRYVELNPYRVTGQPLAPFPTWRWSSLHYLLQPEHRWPEGCTAAFRRVLDSFGSDPRQARGNLLQFLQDGLNTGSWEDFYKVKAHRFLGSDDFVQRMKRQEYESVRQSPRRLRRVGTPGEFCVLAADCFQVSLAALANSDQSRTMGRLRQATAYVARRYYRLPIEGLGASLGRSGSAISMMLARQRKNIENWSETVLLLDALERKDGSSSH